MVKIILAPASGEEINSCKKQAIAECAKNAVDVEFTHNDKTYFCRWEDLFAGVRELVKP